VKIRRKWLEEFCLRGVESNALGDGGTEEAAEGGIEGGRGGRGS